MVSHKVTTGGRSSWRCRIRLQAHFTDEKARRKPSRKAVPKLLAGGQLPRITAAIAERGADLMNRLVSELIDEINRRTAELCSGHE
jgi:hypothetical protein